MKPPQEAEADQFAAYMLMPEKHSAMFLSRRIDDRRFAAQLRLGF